MAGSSYNGVLPAMARGAGRRHVYQTMQVSRSPDQSPASVSHHLHSIDIEDQHYEGDEGQHAKMLLQPEPVLSPVVVGHGPSTPIPGSSRTAALVATTK